jgi:hypothetical protein
MFLKGAIRSGTKGRRTAILAATTVALLLVPVMMYSFSPNPPTGYTGAPGQGQGCAACHGTLTTPSALTISAPATYTPGSTTAVAMSVSIPSSGGFELQILTSAGASAGMLTAGTGSQLTSFSSTITQDLSNSANGTSWSFTWIPPATNVGTVTVYATGGTHNASYLSTATIAASGGTGGGGTPTISASPAGPLNFSATVGGSNPAAQNVSVTSSTDPTGQMFTASVSSGAASWLSVGSGATTVSTPSTEAISVNIAGLAASTTPYTGTVTFTPVTTTIPAVSVTVNLTVNPSGGGGAQTFDVTAVDRLSGGSDYLLLYGKGDATPTGGGSFARFRSAGIRTSAGTPTTVVARGTWTVTGVPTKNSSGCLALGVTLTTTSGTPPGSAGTLTISDTSSGSESAKLVTTGTGASTWNWAGVGNASLGTPGTGCGSGTGGGGGGDDGGTGTGGTPDN